MQAICRIAHDKACLHQQTWKLVAIQRKVLVVMKVVFTLVFTLLICVYFAGCKRQAAPISVNVILSADGRAFPLVGHRIINFTTGKPHTSSGRPIAVNELYPRANEIGKFAASHSPVDIIICDTSEQLTNSPDLQRAATSTANACAPTANCPAFIPSWVPSDRREAVQQVFAAITTE
jgi:hypothetical protein